MTTRLTLDLAEDTFAVWSRDGERIYFASNRNSSRIMNLFWRRADGASEAAALVESPVAQWVYGLIPDPDRLLVLEARPV